MNYNRKLDKLVRIIFSGLLIAFGISFYNIWWNVSKLIAIIKSSDYLQRGIGTRIVGLEFTGSLCFIIATILIITTILVNIYLLEKDYEKNIE